MLNEFSHLSRDFSKLINTSGGNRDHKPKFATVREITVLKDNKKFKINVRNSLGVKDHNNWIYNLNIGNVMNLTPMNSDELNS